MKPVEGRKRVVIEAVKPNVECGRYPVRRFLGDRVRVSVAMFGDGHDHVGGQLLYRVKGERRWRTVPLEAEGNDIWSASFVVDQIGAWQYAVQGWIDHFDTWKTDLRKRLEAQPDPANPVSTDSEQDIPLALRSGAIILERAAKFAKGKDSIAIREVQLSLEWMAEQKAAVYEYPITPGICELAAKYFDPELATRSADFDLWVDRERARFSSWYELFPRSAAVLEEGEKQRHGTFADVRERLPAIAAMGFDVLYLPPISPIGVAYRKGKNNSVTAEEGDEGSPWAIGSSDGGHKAIHKKLGTMEDFEGLVAAARDRGMEIALDIAFQCSPDHPWVKEHPDWFIIRPDGTIQYAENPPKKYQDIYPLNFESDDWRNLWENLHEVFEHWIRHGVKIFRVDNPHTKAFPFTWRNTKADLQQYFEEVTRPPVSDFFTPNLWPNTPDILHASLQEGGRPAFMQRLILAATLGASYGIYGPAFELGENTPAKKVSEEYLNSEKYEIRQWDLDVPYSIAPLITRVNEIRRENVALQSDLSLEFHPVDNPMVMCYHKRGGDNIILVAINLDPKNEQAGWIDLNLKSLGIAHDETFDVEDLLTGVHYKWHDRSNYVALRPDVMPAHVFRVTHAKSVTGEVTKAEPAVDVSE
jgi:starch synthase (maltosyl-transferring)